MAPRQEQDAPSPPPEPTPEEMRQAAERLDEGRQKAKAADKSPDARTKQSIESVRARLRHNFSHHPPQNGQVQRYERVREIAYDFAVYVMDASPPSREQSLAFTKIEEAVFWANAAIARNE